MFIITIPEWKFNNTMVQKGTKWEYFKEEECINLIKTHETNGKDTFMLVDKHAYEAGTTFYVRPTRLFENKEIKLVPTVVRTRSRDLKNLPVYRDGASVEKPILRFDINEINNSDLPSFTVVSSIFQGTQCSHLLSNWVVEDLEGKVLDSNLNNKIDLTSLTIRKLLLERNRGLKIRCQHVGDNFEASSFGELVLELRTGERFYIVKEYDEIDPTKDLFIPIVSKDPSVKLANIVKSAVFKRLNNREDLEGDYIPLEIDLNQSLTKGGFTLKSEFMTAGATFILELYSIDDSGYTISTKVLIKARPALPTMAYDVKDEIKLVAVENNYSHNGREASVKDFYLTEQDYGKFRSGHDKSPNLWDGTITDGGGLNPNDPNQYLDKKIEMFKTINNDMRLASSTGCDGVLIFNGEDYAIVDSPKSGNYPTLKIYKLDIVKNKFNLFGKDCERKDEKAPMGKYGSFYIDRDTETLYYAPVGLSKLELRKINLLTQEMSKIEITDIKMQDGADVEIQKDYFIHNPKFNKTLWFGNDGYMYIQEGWSNKIEQGANLPFVKEVDHFKFVLMNNKDTLVIGINKGNKIVSIHRYDCNTSQFVEIDITPIGKDVVFKGIIKGYRKEIYIQCYDGKNFQWFRYV